MPKKKKKKQDKPVKLEMSFKEAVGRLARTPPPPKKKAKKHTPRRKFK